jgi:general secretion pathway protein K
MEKWSIGVTEYWDNQQRKYKKSGVMMSAALQYSNTPILQAPGAPALRFSDTPSRLFRSSRGVALIMALWVVTVLSVVVLEFCFAMRTEVNVARNYKEEFQLSAIAEGGVQRGIIELIYRHDRGIQQKRKTLEYDELPPEKKEWITDGRPYSLSFDQGTCDVMVMSEGGKINLNLVSEALLRKIIGQFGLEEEARDVIADSILDWRDPDDFYRVNGAENDYYQSLKEPYSCKNGNFDSIEELLLVRGVTPELFRGKKATKTEEGEAQEERIGLKEIFSIYAPQAKIDVNSATSVALRAILGIPNDVAQKIVKAREEKRFDDQRDLITRVPEMVSFMGELGALMTYTSSSLYYTIESKAISKEGGSVRRVKTIVKVAPGEKGGYKVIQWVDALTGS